MKTTITILILLSFGIINTGCNPFKSDHPQATSSKAFDTNLNSKNIINYVEAIDLKTDRLTKRQSLIYTAGDLSFYAEEYSQQGKKVLITETTNDGLTNHSVKKFYFKNDSLVLVQSFTETGSDEGAVFNQQRTFLRNSTAFKVEERTATTAAGIQSQSFIEIEPGPVTKTDRSVLENVAVLNDVINGNDKFEMVFDHFATYPDAKYILLKSKLQPSYTASILANNNDGLIDSLLAYPGNFKDKKLDLKWQIKNNEAVYVPVGNKTSANGLNK